MTKNMRVTALFAALLLVSASISAQISQGGSPYSWTQDKINWRVGDYELEAFDETAMMAEDDINNEFKDVPYRFGKNFDVSLDLYNSGDWYDLPNGDRVWMLGVSSEGAKSINLAFDQFYLNRGCELHIYSEDHQHVLGAFTYKNNAADGLFATYPIPGERIIIEFYEPAETAGQNQLRIETITHAYRDIEKMARDIGDSGSCNNNVVCSEGDPWADQIRSVAMVVVGSNGICTGAMINNTASDGHPYFLTADHCTGGGVTNWVFRFNWQSTTCVGNNVGTFQTVNGSQMLAQGGSADYALLEINNGNAIPSNTNAYFAGWDATGVNPTSQVGIHHPSGDIKKISFDTDAAGTATYGGATCWRIFDWEDGTTEPGSSGSPLFDQNQRIIGQLYGGEASCSNNINDFYGKFDVTYPNVCQWLAPGCNTLVVDGYDPFAPSLALDAQISSVAEPSGSYCAASVTPEVTLRNAGTTTLTTATITYNVDGGASSSIQWNGTLTSGSSVVLTLPAVSPGDGNHTYNVSVSNPNGGTDQNPANDSGSSSFSTTSNGINWTFTLLTDNYPAETSWDIRDGGGNILFSGDNYSGQQTTYTISGCLAEGCYDLNVYDEFGDGLQYQGVVGNYTLEDEFGNVLAQMVAGGNFGPQATHNFCLANPITDGCTDSGACNYDPSATNDDGSCEYSTCAGCTNAAACNYDPTASIDDGSCDLPDGCTNAGACNYDPAASCDDGSCEFTSCAGCTDSGACNFDMTATIDDGSCEFTSCEGCTDSMACNYDATATIDDGSCVAATTYYADTDNDGYGDAMNTVSACSQPAGYVTDNTDCDDDNEFVYPGAPGTAEGIDNNCNQIIDPEEEIPCMGDMNGDGERNVQDLLEYLGEYGCSGPTCRGDFNGDESVNGADLLMFLSVFGTVCPQ